MCNIIIIININIINEMCIINVCIINVCVCNNNIIIIIWNINVYVIM